MHRYAIEKRFPVLSKILISFVLRLILQNKEPTCCKYSFCHFSGIHISYKFIFGLGKVFSVLVMFFRGIIGTVLPNLLDADADRERGLDAGQYEELFSL